MSEPIRLYSVDGKEGYAYGAAQRRAMLDSGEWFSERPEAGAATEEAVTEEAAPVPRKTAVVKRAKGER